MAQRPLRERIHELMKMKLTDGTLVEYLDGAGFSEEWSRDTVVYTDITRKKIDIRTDGKSCWGASEEGIELQGIEIVEGIAYVVSTVSCNYALASKGVKIPLPNEKGSYYKLVMQKRN